MLVNGTTCYQFCVTSLASAVCSTRSMASGEDASMTDIGSYDSLRVFSCCNPKVSTSRRILPLYPNYI